MFSGTELDNRGFPWSNAWTINLYEALVSRSKTMAVLISPVLVSIVKAVDPVLGLIWYVTC